VLLPSVARLFELARLFGCDWQDFMPAASGRERTKNEAMEFAFEFLSAVDRELLESLAARLSKASAVD
jgi:hypothetical protein